MELDADSWNESVLSTKRVPICQYEIYFIYGQRALACLLPEMCKVTTEIASLIYRGSLM